MTHRSTSSLFARVLMGALWLTGLTYAPLVAQIWIGPRVGLQANRAVADALEKTYGEPFKSDYKPGFLIGLDANYEVNRTFSLATGLVYSQKGKIITQTQGGDLRNTATYHHIDMPLLLRTTFGKGYVRWYLNAGGDISYWLGGSGKVQSSQSDNDEARPYSVRFGDRRADENALFISDANRLQFGLSFGGGVFYNLTPSQHVGIDFRYGMGHSHLSQNGTVATTTSSYYDNLKTANHAISISVTYALRIDTSPKRNKGKSVTSDVKGGTKDGFFRGWLARKKGDYKKLPKGSGRRQ